MFANFFYEDILHVSNIIILALNYMMLFIKIKLKYFFFKYFSLSSK